jgi:predicted Zn-ribbon and HTH transcriptional regulator
MLPRASAPPSSPHSAALGALTPAHLPSLPVNFPSPPLGPRQSARKRVKKVRTAPMTIAERRHNREAALPPSTAAEDPAVSELQLGLAFADDEPQDEELTPHVPGPQDHHSQQADPLAAPSNLPIQPPGQSPIDSYRESHESWFVRLIFLLIAVLHTRHHVSFRACSLLLFTLSLIFLHLTLTSSENRIPFTLDTVLHKLHLEDRFAIIPACNVCQRPFQPAISSDSQCPNCKTDLFTTPSATLFRRLTGKAPPPPPPKLSVPVRSLSSLLTEVFAHGLLEDHVQEWLSHVPSPGQYTSFMDGCVAQELTDHNGNLFFNQNSTIDGEIHLGVTWSVDWYVEF